MKWEFIFFFKYQWFEQQSEFKDVKYTPALIFKRDTCTTKKELVRLLEAFFHFSVLVWRLCEASWSQAPEEWWETTTNHSMWGNNYSFEWTLLRGCWPGLCALEILMCFNRRITSAGDPDESDPSDWIRKSNNLLTFLDQASSLHTQNRGDFETYSIREETITVQSVSNDLHVPHWVNI